MPDNFGFAFSPDDDPDVQWNHYIDAAPVDDPSALRPGRINLRVEGAAAANTRIQSVRTDDFKEPPGASLRAEGTMDELVRTVISGLDLTGVAREGLEKVTAKFEENLREMFVEQTRQHVSTISFSLNRARPEHGDQPGVLLVTSSTQVMTRVQQNGRFLARMEVDDAATHVQTAIPPTHAANDIGTQQSYEQANLANGSVNLRKQATAIFNPGAYIDVPVSLMGYVALPPVDETVLRAVTQAVDAFRSFMQGLLSVPDQGMLQSILTINPADLIRGFLEHRRAVIEPLLGIREARVNFVNSTINFELMTVAQYEQFLRTTHREVLFRQLTDPNPEGADVRIEVEEVDESPVEPAPPPEEGEGTGSDEGVRRIRRVSGVIRRPAHTHAILERETDPAGDEEERRRLKLETEIDPDPVKNKPPTRE